MCHSDDEQWLQSTCCHPAPERPTLIHLGGLLKVSLQVQVLFWERFPQGEAVLFQLLCIHSRSKDAIFSWGIPPGFTLADNLVRNVQHLPSVKVNPRARCLGVHYTKLRPQFKRSQTIIPGECSDQVLAVWQQAGNESLILCNSLSGLAHLRDKLSSLEIWPPCTHDVWKLGAGNSQRFGMQEFQAVAHAGRQIISILSGWELGERDTPPWKIFQLNWQLLSSCTLWLCLLHGGSARESFNMRCLLTPLQILV